MLPSNFTPLRVLAAWGLRVLGGEGSGNHGHSGRPGEVGGSYPKGSGKGGTWTPEDRKQITPEHIQRRMQEIAAMSKDTRENTEFLGPIDRPAAILLEANELIPMKDGAWRGTSNTMYLGEESDALVNVAGKPYLASKEEDPNNEDETVWSFRAPEAYESVERFESSTDDKASAVVEFRAHLQSMKALGSTSSGNFGHAGRPGQRGGSAKGDGSAPVTEPAQPVTPTEARLALDKGDDVSFMRFVDDWSKRAGESRAGLVEADKKASIAARSAHDVKMELDILHTKLIRPDAGIPEYDQARLARGMKLMGVKELPTDPSERKALADKTLDALHIAEERQGRAAFESKKAEDALFQVNSDVKNELHSAILMPIDEVRYLRQAGLPSSSSISPASSLLTDPNAHRWSSYSKERNQWISRVQEWVDRAIGGGSFETATIQGKAGNRSHYLRAGSIVKLSTIAAQSALVHEMGHHLENSVPLLHTEMKRFLDARTNGEPAVALSKLLPGHGYTTGEVTRKDAFVDPYVGKIYPYPATEILSMGMQELFKDPLKFFQSDPEHFQVTLRGLSLARQYNTTKWVEKQARDANARAHGLLP